MPVRTRRRNRHVHRWQKTRWVAVGVATALGVTAATGIGSSGAAPGAPTAPSQAAPSFNLGVGQAIAQGIKIDPRAAGLSIGITLAESLAGHQNSVAAAESKAINMGILGTTLAAEGCDGGDPTMPSDQQPQTLRRDSTEDDAAGGVHEQESSPFPIPVDKFVMAASQPVAQSITTATPIDVPGAVSISSMRSEANSAVIDGNLREARALSDIDHLDLGAGAVQINGLHWEAIHHSGAVDEQIGRFTIGSMTIGGQSVPVDDPTAALAQANQVLNQLGIQLRPPTTHTEQTARGSVVFVDPLAIAVVPNTQRDSVTGGILSGAQPVREGLVDALLAADCSNSAFITVADIVIGSLTGAGSFALNLGGAQATTAAINTFQGLGLGGAGRLGAGPVRPPVAAGVLSGAASAAPSRAGTGTAAPAAPQTQTAAPAAAAAAPAADTFDTAPAGAELVGEKGGAMLGVGLAGLLALALAAELDRRKMRRAMREIPLEV